MTEATKIHNLEDIDGDPRKIMDAIFALTTNNLFSTVGQTVGLTRDELEQSLIELWENGFLRFVNEQDKDRIRVDILLPNGEWEPLGMPSIQ